MPKNNALAMPPEEKKDEQNILAVIRSVCPQQTGFVAPPRGQPADDQMALENARDAYTRRSEGCSIWVVKASEIVASQPEDRGEFFDPAESKVYRHPTFYTVPDGMEHM